MPDDDLFQALHSQPFTPFRLCLADGSGYDIRHPELIMLGTRTVIIGLSHNPDALVYDHCMTLDRDQICSIEPADKLGACAAE